MAHVGGAYPGGQQRFRRRAAIARPGTTSATHRFPLIDCFTHTISSGAAWTHAAGNDYTYQLNSLQNIPCVTLATATGIGSAATITFAGVAYGVSFASLDAATWSYAGQYDAHAYYNASVNDSTGDATIYLDLLFEGYWIFEASLTPITPHTGDHGRSVRHCRQRPEPLVGDGPAAFLQ